MKEKLLEQYLKNRVEELDGIAYKFTSPGRRSVPDRLCVFPNGILAFVEVKVPGGLPTEAQYREMERLQDRGQWVEWVDTQRRIDKLIDKVEQMIGGE